jgi:predicted aspartyl protease
MTTPYNKSYTPPFPTLPIVLGEGSSRVGPLPALIDSGADATLVPIDLLKRIGVGEGEEVTIRSHFGERQSALLFLVPLAIEGTNLVGLYVVGDEMTDEIILGRNVLNKLALFLDGPTQQTDLLDDAMVQRLRARRE